MQRRKAKDDTHQSRNDWNDTEKMSYIYRYTSVESRNHVLTRAVPGESGPRRRPGLPGCLESPLLFSINAGHALKRAWPAWTTEGPPGHVFNISWAQVTGDTCALKGMIVVAPDYVHVGRVGCGAHDCRLGEKYKRVPLDPFVFLNC